MAWSKSLCLITIYRARTVQGQQSFFWRTHTGQLSFTVNENKYVIKLVNHQNIGDYNRI